MTNFEKRVVVKIGGSLLTQPSLPSRIEQWLENQDSSKQHIFIAGGGEAVDAIRRIDAVNPLPTESTHWSSIAQMDLNAEFLSRWLPSWAVVHQYQKLTLCDAEIILFSVESFLREQEPKLPGTPLPVGWQTTSDAIAARIAECLAAELVLLKSIKVDMPYHWQSLTERGIIDPVMASMADRITVRLETLPSES